MNKRILEEISNWSIEAKEESTENYFFHFNDVSLIERGQKNYVIGRKGTGKTAIAEYLHRRKSFDKFSRLLSFKNFPFNALYQHADNQYNRPNQYITFWTYVIYSYICSMLSENADVCKKVSFDLKSCFDFEVKGALAQSVRKITDKNYSLSALGFGAGVSNVTAEVGFDFARANIALRDFILENCDESSYYVIFDELDEDYRDVLNPDRRDGYFELLISLFKAVQNIRGELSSQLPNIRLVILLRDDIFDLCRDVDKNKWLDRAIVLKWDESQLRNLTKFRLSQAASVAGLQVTTENAWGNTFSVSATRYQTQGGKSIETFKYLTSRTLMRPRDVISYLRECARVACSLDSNLITNEHIKDAGAAHSSYLRRELIDELFPVLEDISEIFDVLSRIRKHIFTRKEFNDRYREYQNQLPAEKRSKLSETQVLKILFHFNVLGNITTGNHRSFAYSSDVKVLNPDENLCIHNGLLRSLNI